jgi:xylulokinase
VQGAPLVVGLDCSTHGAKAVAWDARGEPVLEARAGYPLLTPRDGCYEQRAREWLGAAIAVLGELGRQLGPRVRAVGLTGQRETFVGVDARGEPVRDAIVWMDERAHTQVRALRERLGDEGFHRLTGKPLSITPSIAKLMWIRAHEPEVFASARRWLDVQGFLARRLAGADATSLGGADPMGLVDLPRGDWGERLLEASGVTRDTLPALLPCGSSVGPLTAAVASQTGLERSAPLVLTAGDGQVAALAAGIFSLDRASLNLGTAIVSGAVSDIYRVDRAFRTMSGAAPGTYLLETDLKGGTFTLDWLHERLLGGREDRERLEREAAVLGPGAGGLVLVPYLASVMNPYWDDDASGIVVGLRGGHGPAHLHRAVLEGIALEQRLQLGALELATGVRVGEVRVLGGGARSELWCQILSDVLNRPVVRTRSSEASSLGAAMLAAVAAGLHGGVREAAETMGGTAELFEPGGDASRYDELYGRVYARLYPALREAVGELAGWVRAGAGTGTGSGTGSGSGSGSGAGAGAGSGSGSGSGAGAARGGP